MVKRRNWKARFADLLKSPTEADWQRALMLKHDKVPRALYQYRRFDPEGYWLQNLLNDAVRMSPAKDFNDPFDSGVTIDMSRALGDGIRHRLRTNPPAFLKEKQRAHLLQSNHDGYALSNLLQALDTSVSRPDKPDAAQDMREAVEAMDARWATLTETYQQQITLTCFTTKHTNLTMWAHYADHHRGFCVAFDLGALARDDDRRKFLFPVCYDKNRYDISDMGRPCP